MVISSTLFTPNKRDSSSNFVNSVLVTTGDFRFGQAFGQPECQHGLRLSGIRLEFLKPIKDVTVKERETAEFSVELSHENIPVLWYKNGARLHPGKLVHMSEDGRVHTLAFKEVSIDDTSMIKVEAMDKMSEAMLTVLG